MTGPVGILLAAGTGRRFGDHKLMHRLVDGTPLGVAAARVLVEVLPRSVAVIRHGDERLRAALLETGLEVVENPLAGQGMGNSIACGVGACHDAAGWLVALADMPWIKPSTVHAVADRLRAGATLVAPSYRGRRGHPVGFAAAWGERLAALDGDRGARGLLDAQAAELTLVDVDDSGSVRDVDHPHDVTLPAARGQRGDRGAQT